jgi:hypothetical protein
LAISGAQYKEGKAERFKGTGEELASYYYKSGYSLSSNVLNRSYRWRENVLSHWNWNTFLIKATSS